MLDTEFYLPQVRIPKPHKKTATARTKKPEPKAANPEYTPSPLALPRHLVNYSESDGEDYVSEADRDARLA